MPPSQEKRKYSILLYIVWYMLCYVSNIKLCVCECCMPISKYNIANMYYPVVIVVTVASVAICSWPNVAAAAAGVLERKISIKF